MAKKKDKKKKLKKQNAKKKALKKKELKKKELKKKELKKKESRKKELKKKKQSKKELKKKLKKKKAVKKAETAPKKNAISNESKTAAVITDNSSNYNVRDALARLKSLKSQDEVKAFTQGEERLTITKAVTVALRRVNS
jgi:hypothetical protein